MRVLVENEVSGKLALLSEGENSTTHPHMSNEWKDVLIRDIISWQTYRDTLSSLLNKRQLKLNKLTPNDNYRTPNGTRFN